MSDRRLLSVTRFLGGTVLGVMHLDSPRRQRRWPFLLAVASLAGFAVLVAWVLAHAMAVSAANAAALDAWYAAARTPAAPYHPARISGLVELIGVASAIGALAAAVGAVWWRPRSHPRAPALVSLQWRDGQVALAATPGVSLHRRRGPFWEPIGDDPTLAARDVVRASRGLERVELAWVTPSVRWTLRSWRAPGARLITALVATAAIAAAVLWAGAASREPPGLERYEPYRLTLISTEPAGDVDGGEPPIWFDRPVSREAYDAAAAIGRTAAWIRERLVVSGEELIDDAMLYPLEPIPWDFALPGLRVPRQGCRYGLRP